VVAFADLPSLAIIFQQVSLLNPPTPAEEES
jgi:hypothetical protein